MPRPSPQAILSHSTDFNLSLLIPKLVWSGLLVSVALVVMLVAALGAVALTVAALPALDRFIRW
jgi:hypothetical protein